MWWNFTRSADNLCVKVCLHDSININMEMWPCARVEPQNTQHQVKQINSNMPCHNVLLRDTKKVLIFHGRSTEKVCLSFTTVYFNHNRLSKHVHIIRNGDYMQFSGKHYFSQIPFLSHTNLNLKLERTEHSRVVVVVGGWHKTIELCLTVNVHMQDKLHASNGIPGLEEMQIHNTSK